MTVSSFTQSDISGQSGAAWFPTVDGNVAVLARLAAAFAPHQTSLASLSVVVDRGALLVGSTLVEVAQQTSAALTAPTSNPRIDRIVVDRTTGSASVVTGVEAASPVPPALPANALPVARVRLEPGATAVTNAAITDERVLWASGGGGGGSGGLIGIRRFTANGTYTPTPGTSSIIVEVYGGGGSGGGSAAPTGSQGSAAGGGSAGSFARARLTSGFDSVAITVGAGGAATAAGFVGGNAGGTSSFGTLITAPGGRGGPGGPAYTPPAVVGGGAPGDTATGGNLISAFGACGGYGVVLTATSVIAGVGGPGPFGGSAYGGGNTGGQSADAPGAGGGGASSIGGAAAHSGGAGGPGLVLIYEYA